MRPLTRKPATVEIDGVEYFATPCTIKSTMLGIEDHGILTCFVHLEWPGAGVGFGGYGMDEPVDGPDGKNAGRRGTAYGCEFVRQVIATVGVDRWEMLPGARLHVLNENADSWGRPCAGIASYDLSRAFLPDQLAKTMGRK